MDTEGDNSETLNLPSIEINDQDKAAATLNHENFVGTLSSVVNQLTTASREESKIEEDPTHLPSLHTLDHVIVAEEPAAPPLGTQRENTRKADLKPELKDLKRKTQHSFQHLEAEMSNLETSLEIPLAEMDPEQRTKSAKTVDSADDTDFLQTDRKELNGLEVSQDDSLSSLRKRQKMILPEPRRTWQERAACVFCYLHPRIGHKDFHLTAEMASVSANTLRGWLTKPPLMQKWIPFVENMTAKEVGLLLRLDLSHLGVGPEEKVDVKGYQGLISKKNLSLFLIGKGQKRVQNKPRCSKWHEQFLFIKDHIVNAWENGMPLLVRDLRDKLHEKYNHLLTNSTIDQSSEEMKTIRKFFQMYLKVGGKNYPTTVNTLVTRIISRAGYVIKDRVVYEKLPKQWRQKAGDFQQQFQDWFRSVKADCIVCSDETYMGGEEEIFKKRQRDASFTLVSEMTQFGCNVVVSATLPEVKLLNPFIIMKGNRIDVSERSYRTATVVYEPESVITSSSMKLLMRQILSQFPNKRVAWVLDKHSVHLDAQFHRDIADVNADQSLPGSLHVIYIPEGLTSVLHVPEAFLHQFLRPRVRMSCDDKLLHSTKDKTIEYDGLSSLRRMSGMDCVTLIEDVWNSYNSSDEEKRHLKKAFSKCGQNPYDPDAEKVFSDYIANEALANIQRTSRKMETPPKSLPLTLNLP